MVLPAMDFLLEMIEGVEKYRYDEYMSIYIHAEWKKLTGYYQKADRAPAYIAAIVLDPTKKMVFFLGLGTRMANKCKAKSQNILGTVLSFFYRLGTES